MIDLSKLLSDEQDEAAVRKILPKIEELLTREEAVEYIAVQKGLTNLSPDAVVITNRRFIIVRPKLFGMDFSDVMWRDVQDVHMSEQMLTATVTCKTTKGATASVDSLPKKQARRVYAYAQQVEEQAHETRKQTELERIRAGAGGVVVHAPAPAVVPATAAAPPLPIPMVEDPVQVLGKLKQLLDAGLVTQGEFDQKKVEVLARL